MADSDEPTTPLFGHPDAAWPLSPGATLGGFSIEAVLGEGGQGVVYKAWDTVAERHVALKTVKSPDPASAGRLLREARKAAGLRHESLVPVYYVTPADERPFYVVMEYVAGTTLHGIIRTEAPLPERAALRVLAQVLPGLSHAHERGVVHLDIKPANLLVDRESGKARLSDFGMALHHAERNTTSSGGTPPYMAPEQIEGQHERFDGRTDIWAIGVVLYEMLTGHRPFGSGGDDRRALVNEITRVDPKPPSQWVSHISPECDAICLKCLSKPMGDRYPSVARLLEDVERALAQTTGAGGDEEPQAEALGPPLGTPRSLAALGGCLTAVAAVVCAVLVAAGVVESEDVRRFLQRLIELIPKGRRG